MPSRVVRIGCAGWSVPKPHAAAFPADGSHLARYAQVFNAVEINSCFYRPHRRTTYERWAASVPDDFAFSAKLPKQITHERRLADAADLLDAFLEQIGGLGKKLGPLLVQLPPSLAFDAAVARGFFAALRARFSGGVVCEPRHTTWFGAAADETMREFKIARVAADPPAGGAAFDPGGFAALRYFRLHGAPRIYYSDYTKEQIAGMAQRLAAEKAAQRWCIFDNTALGAAAGNALGLQAMMAGEAPA